VEKPILPPSPEAEFMDEIQTKVFRVFLLAIHSQLIQFSCCTLLRIKEDNLIENYTPPPHTPSLLSRLCPGTSKKLYVHEFGFDLRLHPKGNIVSWKSRILYLVSSYLAPHPPLSLAVFIGRMYFYTERRKIKIK
jgi:hypothetical protein